TGFAIRERGPQSRGARHALAGFDHVVSPDERDRSALRSDGFRSFFDVLAVLRCRLVALSHGTSWSHQDFLEGKGAGALRINSQSTFALRFYRQLFERLIARHEVESPCGKTQCPNGGRVAGWSDDWADSPVSVSLQKTRMAKSMINKCESR